MTKEDQEHLEVIRRWFDEALRTLKLTRACYLKEVIEAKKGLRRALKFIYARQTACEQLDESTFEKNGVGFNKADVKWAVGMIELFRYPSEVELMIYIELAYRLRKYSSQLIDSRRYKLQRKLRKSLAEF